MLWGLVALRGSLPAGQDDSAFDAATTQYDYHVWGEDWLVGACGSRARQSPIALPAQPPPPEGTLWFDYEPLTEGFPVLNNGHAIAADLAARGLGGLTIDGSFFALQSLTLHGRSEHTLGGAQLPLEVHLMHQRVDSGALVGVAVLVESPLPPRSARPGRDAPPDPRLALLRDPGVLQRGLAPATELQPLDLAPWLEGATFFHYAGSLTVPPCSETVEWYVRAEPILAQNEQVSVLFEDLFRMTQDHGNARAVMPLAGRAVRAVRAQRGAPAPAAGSPTPSKPDVREFAAQRDAEAAQAAVKDAQAHLQDLGARLQQADAARKATYATLR